MKYYDLSLSEHHDPDIAKKRKQVEREIQISRENKQKVDVTENKAHSSIQNKLAADPNETDKAGNTQTKNLITCRL